MQKKNSAFMFSILVSLSMAHGFNDSIQSVISRSTSKIVEWWKKKRAKRTKNVLQCPMC